MTNQKETPASLRRQAEGNTGVRCDTGSVPGWSAKRRAKSVVHYGGEYLSPEALNARFAVEAQQERERRGGPQAADAVHRAQPNAEGLPGARTPENPGISTADRSPSGHFDPETGEILPCRSLETTATKGTRKATPKGLSGPAKKVAATLTENIRYLCEKHGIQHIAFFTLTFADHVIDPKEAQRRLHSLTAGVLDERYPHRIRVFERQKSGRIHYHFVLVVPEDIHTGVDPEAIAQGDYATANKALRREWAFWHKTCKKYGFGRHNLQPVKSSENALALYVGKYIGKGFQFRNEADKGVRLVTYSGDARRMVCKHTALSKYSNEWRAKVQTFVHMVQAAKPHSRIRTIDDIALVLNDKRWSYNHRDFILELPPSDLSVPF